MVVQMGGLARSERSPCILIRKHLHKVKRTSKQHHIWKNIVEHQSSFTNMPESTALTFDLLPAEIRQSSAIGAEVQLPPGMPMLDLDRLTEKDKEVLQEALFRNQVIVIRGQKGIDPTVLPRLAKVFDPNASDIHSAGEKAVSDPKNILSAYKAGRIPRAPQVGIIGSGKFRDYEGLDELEVVHLVQSHSHYIYPTH